MRTAIAPEELADIHDVYWSCKALLHDKHLILLRDRQIFSPHASAERNEQFMAWLRRTAIPWLRQQLVDSEESAFFLREDPYCLKSITEPDGTVYLGAIAVP